MNEYEILLPIVGIHLFLGISLVLISGLLFIFLSKSQTYIVISSLLLLTFAHFYYYLYYTGYLANFPYLIFYYPILNILGHVFLFHSFLSILGIRNFWNRKTLLHLIFPILQIIQIYPLLALNSNSQINIYYSKKENFTPEGIAGENSEIFFYMIALFYISCTNYLFIKKFYPIIPLKNSENNLSNIDANLHLIKYKWILFALYLVLIISFLSWMLIPNKIFHVTIPLLFSIFIPSLLVGLVFYPYILQLGVQVPVHSNFSIPKYAKSNLHNMDLVELERKINQCMNEKIFLQEDINLPKMARLCDATVHQLSAYFNLIKGKKYSEFIRGYRIQEAKNLLLHKPKWNVTRIGFESGFNSSSAFFEAFKSEVGISPTEFRKKINK
jgi:AraC-like DNA-binding protein